jgi:CHAT domain-containing protein
MFHSRVLQSKQRIVVIAAGLLAAWTYTTTADEPQANSQKPPYARMLKGDDAKLAEELGKKIEEAEKADKYDEAIALSEKLLALRAKFQGTDHWETVGQKWNLDKTRKVGALTPDDRASWRQVLEGTVEAERLEENEEYAKAEALWEEYRRSCLAVLGEKHPETAFSYNNLALVLDPQGKHADAQPLYQKALDVRFELFGEKHPATALSYNNLASNMDDQGKYADAQPLYQKALDIRRELLGEKHPDTAEAFNNLAECEYNQENYADALPHYQKALAVRLELFGEQHADTAESYYNLAECMHEQGKYAEALPHYQKALAIRLGLFGEQHADTADSYYSLADILYALGKYDDARAVCQKSLAIRRELFGEMHAATADSCNSLALISSRSGKFADALLLCRQALAVRLELLGENHADIVESYNDLADILCLQGKYADAVSLCRKALSINVDLSGASRLTTARNCTLLALALGAQEKYSEAQTFHQQALDIRVERLGENHPVTAISYGNLAGNLESQGKSAEARLLFEKALAVRREVFGEKHPWTAMSYSNLAYFLRHQGEYSKSLSFAQKALDIRLELLGNCHPETAYSYSALAYNLTALGKHADAQSLLQRASASYEAARLSVASRGLERAVFADEQSPYPLRAAIEAQFQSPSAAWSAAEIDLARGLSDEIALRRGAALSPDEQNQQADVSTRLTQMQPRILQLISKLSLPDSEKAELATLQAGRTKLEAELAELGASLSQREVAPLEHVQSAIPIDGALVMWVDVSDRRGGVNEHWGCVVRRTGEPKWERSQGAGPDGSWTRDDGALPEQLWAALAPGIGAQSDVNSLAQELYAQRLAPLARHLEGVKTLYIAGVNEMAGIPIEVLTHDFAVSYVPSGTFLAQLSQRDPASKSGLVALGDPLFTRPELELSPKSASEVSGATKVELNEEQALEVLDNGRQTDALLASLRGGNWNDLPGTRAEIMQIAKLFGDQTSMLLNSAASEQSLEELRQKGDLSKFRYLHFATHGEANNVKAFESVLILAQDKLPNDPLPRAGEPFINGQLSANEVLEFWELNAELVTLSACETALGRKGGGDGLLGFAQAFLKAGSRAVCLSLWKVDDTATALLMTRFYQNLLGKRPDLDKPMPKAQALTEAKKWLRELSLEEAKQLAAAAMQNVNRQDRGRGEPLNLVVPAVDPAAPEDKSDKPFAHPRYWSAFILIGDPN